MSTRRDIGEVRAVGLAGRGIVVRRAGRAVGRAQHVGRHDEQPVGVDRLARSDQPVPRALGAALRPRAGIASGHVLARRVAVGQQDGVAAIRRQRAVGLVGQRDLRHHRAVLQPERLGGEGPPSRRWSSAPSAWAAVPSSALRAGRAASSGRRDRLIGMAILVRVQARAGWMGSAASEATACAARRLRSASGRMNSRPMMPPAISRPPRIA